MRRVLLGLILGLAAAVAWFSWVKWSAHSNLERGKVALGAGDAATALRYFDKCLEVRPPNAEAHFRAAQAVRQSGDLTRAASHLDEAARLDWDPAAIELERALLRAQGGDLRSVEALLVRWVVEDRPDAHHVLAVLVPAFVDEFRWPEASALVAKWTRLQPGSTRAWKLQGEIFERLRRKNDAVSAFREATRLDPEDHKTRFDLARLLLETRQSPAEAAEHLEWLRQRDPGNPAILVQLAVCREAQGLPDEAAAILDDVLAAHASEPRANYVRGRLELSRGRAVAALPFLRRAAELDPGEPDTLYSLFLCLRQVGTPEEARVAEERWKQTEADLKRVAELARAIAASPRDPDLRREMGELFLKHGREPDGLGWLKSALRERPDHEPTHRLLSDYYDRTGQPGLADYHRGFLRGLKTREK